jgi:hypothetical protein
MAHAGNIRRRERGGDLPAARLTMAWGGGEARQAGRSRVGCAAMSGSSFGRSPGEAVVWRPPAVWSSRSAPPSPRSPFSSPGAAAAERGKSGEAARVSSGGRGGFIGWR